MVMVRFGAHSTANWKVCGLQPVSVKTSALRCVTLEEIALVSRLLLEEGAS